MLIKAVNVELSSFGVLRHVSASCQSDHTDQWCGQVKLIT